MAEFKILVVEKLILMGNIAFNKLTHTNQTNGAYIRDGKPSSKWTSVYYPGYVDIDLEKRRLIRIQVVSLALTYE